MLTPYGINYAVHIITTHFGNLVAKVCETLLRRGPLTLKLLNQFTELNSRQINNSLLILIQHNCVQAFSIEPESELGVVPKTEIEYLALFDNILHRMRFPKYLGIVSEKLEKDKDCEQLLEGLLQNGRLTLQQMVERAQSNKYAGNRPLPDAVRESLQKLLAARFVERCPAAEPVLSAGVMEETPARKRGAKSAKMSEVPVTMQQRVLAAAVPTEAIRFSISEYNIDAEKSDHPSPSTSNGQKRKFNSLEIDGESEDENSVVPWRANFEEFTRCLRHKACIEKVRSQHDDAAANVLSAILEATRSAETTVKTEITGPLSLDNVYEEVMKNEAGRTMTIERVRASLAALGCSDDYRIDIRSIIEQAQHEEVESIVLKRYGRDAYRMFRLLSKDGRLVETDKISDSTFVEKKDAPMILFKLWKDEYLHMEKVVVTGPRQAQLMLWKVNKRNLWEHVLDEMFHASLNLCQRLAFELEKEKELLTLPPDKRRGPLEKRYSRLRSVRILLESSLFKLDDSLMLFHDF